MDAFCCELDLKGSKKTIPRLRKDLNLVSDKELPSRTYKEFLYCNCKKKTQERSRQKVQIAISTRTIYK
jgi:hypothetical protein